MTFLDTGILVGALLEKHPEHAPCRKALEESEAPFTDAHALAETFATLTGFYQVPTAAAAELTLGLKASLAIEIGRQGFRVTFILQHFGYSSPLVSYVPYG